MRNVLVICTQTKWTRLRNLSSILCLAQTRLTAGKKSYLNSPLRWLTCTDLSRSLLIEKHRGRWFVARVLLSQKFPTLKSCNEIINAAQFLLWPNDQFSTAHFEFVATKTRWPQDPLSITIRFKCLLSIVNKAYRFASASSIMLGSDRYVTVNGALYLYAHLGFKHWTE